MHRHTVTDSANGHGHGKKLGSACGPVFFFNMLAHICLAGLEGPFEPAIPHRLQQQFSSFAAELAAARHRRVLAQTGFAILYLF